MPYIPQEDRGKVIDNGYARTVGELNYLITQSCLDYLGKYMSPTYASCNEVMGVLECVKQEFYRRVAAPMEDRKCDMNGDVFK